jgi:hypothetical protein
MIAFILDHILTPFWPYIAGAAVIVAGWFTAKRQGAQAAKAKRDVVDAKAYRETNERMQDADAAMGDDPAILRDSLRKRDPNVR